jgi:ribonuclease J
LPDTDDEGDPMEDIVIKAVRGAVTSIPKSRRKDKDLVAEAARRAARSEIQNVWGKKTLCKVMVTQL